VMSWIKDAEEKLSRDMFDVAQREGERAMNSLTSPRCFNRKGDHIECEDEPLDEQEQQIRDMYSGITEEHVRAAMEGAKRLAYTGLAPDAPITENDQGGQQSKVEGRFDLIPPLAMFALAQIMEHGAQRYAPNNWRKISVDDHVNHGLMHLFAYLAGDTQDDHLGHALARAAMAKELEMVEKTA
jgi:hypothetical protein